MDEAIEQELNTMASHLLNLEAQIIELRRFRFADLTTNALNIVDDAGRLRARIASDDAHAGLVIYDADGVPVAHLLADEDGGALTVTSPDGEAATTITAEPDG